MLLVPQLSSLVERWSCFDVPFYPDMPRVRYTNHTDALMAITCLDGTSLDDRIIKVGIDPGFKQGRQFGRGLSGGQVRSQTLRVAGRGTLLTGLILSASRKDQMDTVLYLAKTA